MAIVKNFGKYFVDFVFLLFFSSFIYAQYPQFEFNDQNLPQGAVNIDGLASSGVEIELYVNSNFIGRRDVISPSKEILLNGSIIDVSVGVGSNIIFKNNDQSPISLNISGQTITLFPSQDFIFHANYQPQDIIYQDLQTSQIAKISIIDEKANFSFEDVEQSYLKDGKNNISFVLNYPIYDKTNSEKYEYEVYYDKYPNTILLENYTNITKYREANFIGRVAISSHPLYYALNQEGIITNLGILIPIALNGNKFNITISNLHEGNNTIRFISLDPTNNNIFTGDIKVNTIVDTKEPEIEITNSYFVDKDGYKSPISFNGQTGYINGKDLIINITTDASEFKFDLNNKTYDSEIVNGSVSLKLNLVEGKNSLKFIAKDLAGNIKKESHVIEVNTKGPQLILDSMKPESLFKGKKTAHFYFQTIKGKVDEGGGVKVTVFSYVKGTTVYNKEGREIPVSCHDFKPLFIRNLGQLDGKIPRGPQLNLDESQVSFSLQSFMFNKQETTTDSEGNFDVILGLQEKDFNKRDYYKLDNYDKKKTKNEEVGLVKSRNIICFILEDKFGNIEIKDFDVTLDAGNTMWRPGEITTIPNTIYAAEIENQGDVRSGSSYIQFGMIAKFNYIGPGEVNYIAKNGVRISEDRTYYSKKNKKTPRIRIKQSEVKYKFDKKTNELIVYVPVSVLPLKIDPLNYPDNFDLALEMRITYTVGDKDIPIDTKNPVYFRTKINVERPLEHTKWLSPKMLNDLISFLNKTTYYTKKATDFMGLASVGGVLTCTGAKLVHAYKIAAAKTIENEAERKKAIQEADKMLYQICDRVACSASPSKCDLEGQDEEGFIKVKNLDPVGRLDKSKIGNDLTFKDSNTGLISGELSDVRFLGKCDYNGDGKKDDGVLISADALKYKDQISIFGGKTSIQEKSIVRNICVQAKYSNNKISGIKLNNIGNVCYNEDSPNYDNLRCNFFNPSNPFPGKDPSTSIISSIQCACITDTYSHLKVALRVQEGIKKCLEQAKIGVVKGSYCERLMSQAVCDIATNVILPEALKSIKPRKSAGGDEPHKSSGLDFLAQLKKSEKTFNQRYRGSILTKAGLSTDQIINKACVGAISGDWSVLTENILSSIDQNEVEPVFGPPFPVSRQMGYNPLTGELTIQYRFTNAVVSGGQTIRIKAELVCDSSGKSGQYCPQDGYVVSSEMPGRGFKYKYLPPVRKGGSVQDTIVITDKSAKYWYNKLRLTYEYELKGKLQKISKEFDILHKQESLLGNCYFTGGTMGEGAGISCKSLFTNDALISLYTIDDKNTKIVPQKTFYPSNFIYLDLAYDIRNNDEESNQDIVLAYIPECNVGEEKKYYLPKDEGQIKSLPYLSKPLNREGTNNLIVGRKTIKLSYVPQINLEGQESYVSEFNVLEENGGSDLYLKITSTTSTSAAIVKPNRIEDVSAKKSLDLTLQNLNVNQNNPQNQYLFYKVGKINGGKIRVYFKNKPENIILELGTYNNKEFNLIATGSDPSREVDFLKSGSCQVRMRLVPQDIADQLTEENFDTFNLASANSQGDILTNVEGSEIVVKKFNVRKRPNGNENRGFFELTYPVDSTSVVYENGKILVPISYVYQTIFGREIDNTRLELKLNIERVGSKPKKDERLSDENRLVSLKLITFDFSDKTEAINKLFENNRAGIISGLSGAPKATLEYKFYEGDKLKKEGAIKLYLRKGDVVVESENLGSYR